jgi:hypothetical protein
MILTLCLCLCFVRIAHVCACFANLCVCACVCMCVYVLLFCFCLCICLSVRHRRQLWALFDRDVETLHASSVAAAEQRTRRGMLEAELQHVKDTMEQRRRDMGEAAVACTLLRLPTIVPWFLPSRDAERACGCCCSAAEARPSRRAGSGG